MEFSAKRFHYLFVKQWKENKSAYTLGIISIPVLLCVVLLMIAYSSSLSEDIQSMVFAFGMIVFGGIFCATLLSEFATKPKGVKSLTLPVSPLEKLLVALLYGLVIYPLVYGALAYPTLVFAHYVDFDVFGNLNSLVQFNLRDVSKISFAVIFLLSFVILASLFYRRFIFIKAALTGLVLIFVLTTINTVMSKVIVGSSQPEVVRTEVFQEFNFDQKTAGKIKFELDDSGPFSSLSFDAGSYGSFYVQPGAAISTMNTIVFILVIVIMIIACFYRLKETEL